MASLIGTPGCLAAVHRSGLVDTAREPVFDELTKAAAEVMRAPFALLSVMDHEMSFWKSTYGIPDAMRSETVADSFCQYVVERRQELYTADVRTNEITSANPTIEAKGVRAWAGCPVELDGEVLGTLCVIDSEVREWSVEDRAVLHGLAAIASREIAMRAQLREAEDVAASATTESARVRMLLATLRASLLPPSLPVIRGLDLAAWFAAADDGDMLLGDFYDVFPLGNGRWGLVVGDVCGHGAEAAKLTSLARYSLRSAAVHHRDPARVMAEVDIAIREDPTDRGRFVTVCYFDIDINNGIEIRWTRAGHPHPIIVSNTGAARVCGGADGPPLGLTNATDPAAWTVAQFRLAMGERLLVFTDGLTDARSAETGLCLGDAGLVNAIGCFDAASEPTSESLVAYISATVGKAFGAWADDIAMVVLGPK